MTATPLDRLAHLAAQRTARTDRLLNETHALLAQLEASVEVGDSVQVDGWELSLRRLRSNVGSVTHWRFADDNGTGCYLDLPFRHDGFLHGDFNVPLRGPWRPEVIAFASRATRFVLAFAARHEAEGRQLDSAIDQVAQAAAQLQGAP